jgi:hypothetical protein
LRHVYGAPKKREAIGPNPVNEFTVWYKKLR